MTMSEIAGGTVALYAAARKSDIDLGSLAVYGEWTPFRRIAEIQADNANRRLPIDPPGKPWTVWTRAVTYRAASPVESSA